MSLIERQNIEYSDREKRKHEKYKEILSIDIEDIEIYENQKTTACEVIAALCNKKVINVMVVAKTQSGKTGTMISVIHEFVTHPCNLIPLKNIYIISGLSSRDWMIQTKERMPELIRERVYHQDNLMRAFLDDIKDKENILIIMDEIQIAAKEKQTLYKTFQEAGFYDKQYLFKKDIKIVEFTATPDGTIYDLQEWKENASIIKMEPGKGYVGANDLLRMNRVKQYKNLKDIGEVREIKKFLEINPNLQKKYHIIRVNVGNGKNKVIEHFKNVFGDKAEYINHFQNDSSDINDTLELEPLLDTFIFIKEKLRCAKSITKTHLGVVYERYSEQVDDTVIIQGLVGRGTGYDDNGTSVYFTNIDSIKKYEKLWQSSFEDKEIKWQSKTTKLARGKIVQKSTYNDIEHMGFKRTKADKIDSKVEEFSKLEDAKKFVKEEVGGSPRPKITLDSDGFVQSNIRSVKKKRSISDIIKDKNWGLGEKNKYRIHPCYKDLKDINSLKFIVLYIV